MPMVAAASGDVSLTISRRDCIAVLRYPLRSLFTHNIPVQKLHNPCEMNPEPVWDFSALMSHYVPGIDLLVWVQWWVFRAFVCPVREQSQALGAANRRLKDGIDSREWFALGTPSHIVVGQLCLSVSDTSMRARVWSD